MSPTPFSQGNSDDRLSLTPHPIVRSRQKSFRATLPATANFQDNYMTKGRVTVAPDAAQTSVYVDPSRANMEASRANSSHPRRCYEDKKLDQAGTLETPGFSLLSLNPA